ncbi:aminotransferase [Fennellomyces sp. T-0311]|nr:aminotransferase [Fennellomyces sp. T-0311]
MGGFALLETILYDPAQGFYLLDQHIDRLLKAAADFHANDTSSFVTIPSVDQVKTVLHTSVPSDSTFKRVRLLYDQKLSVEYTDLGRDYKAHEQLASAVTGDALTVMLDTDPLPCAASDPFIVHKTTQRDIYNDARKRMRCGQQGGPFDVVLWNKQGQVTETSIANIAIQTVGGTWITPSLECGLLPGVFRDKLLNADGTIVEGVVTVDDLINAQKGGCPIVCFNSVRKAYRVQLDLSA